MFFDNADNNIPGRKAGKSKGCNEGFRKVVKLKRRIDVNRRTI